MPQSREHFLDVAGVRDHDKIEPACFTVAVSARVTPEELDVDIIRRRAFFLFRLLLPFHAAIRAHENRSIRPGGKDLSWFLRVNRHGCEILEIASGLFPGRSGIGAPEEPVAHGNIHNLGVFRIRREAIDRPISGQTAH